MKDWVAEITEMPRRRNPSWLRAFLLFSFALCPFFHVRADDWPQWRGPNRTDISKETGLLTSWPEKGPPLVWTSNEIGAGYSSPAVVGDRLYILGSRGTVENAFAIDT